MCAPRRERINGWKHRRFDKFTAGFQPKAGVLELPAEDGATRESVFMLSGEPAYCLWAHRFPVFVGGRAPVAGEEKLEILWRFPSERRIIQLYTSLQASTSRNVEAYLRREGDGKPEG